MQINATKPDTTVEIAQNVAPALFSTTLPNGRKATIHTPINELNELTAPLKLLPADERAEAITKFRMELTANTDEEDKLLVRTAVVGLANQGQLDPNNISKVPAKLEFTVAENDDQINPMTRQAYVVYFKAHQRRTAIASLQMCRVVFEASKMLTEYDFDEFCKNIGYKADSSTIRKFIVVGKVYPRLIKYADQLPAAWTSIYALTQMPADDFERCIEDGYRLCDLTGGEIDALVKKTKQTKSLMSPFKLDKKEQGYCVAKVFFTKQMDDADLRLLQKAFDEIAARLPVKLSIKKEVLELQKARELEQYEALKDKLANANLDPSTWNLTSAANADSVKDAA